MARFEIPPSKIIAIVHDNGANIVAAANILKEKHGWSSVRCTGHTLQLVINAAKLATVLKPFECVTVFMSGQKYATISAIPPLVKGLLKSTQSAPYESAPLQAFQLTAVQQLQERWKRETAFSDRAPNTVILAMVFDPRFRKQKFLSPDEVLHVQTKVQTMALEERRKMDVQQHGSCSVTSTDTTATESTPLATLLDSLLGSDGEEEDRAGEAEDVHTQVRNEVLTYFGEKSLAKEENPLLWWKANNDRFPMLARLAKSYLCIPATATPSERLFSAAGNIASKKRASLSQEHVNILTVLHCSAQCKVSEQRE